jgi:hypothetical protein
MMLSGRFYGNQPSERQPISARCMSVLTPAAERSASGATMKLWNY